jgi:hypothetical protein
MQDSTIDLFHQILISGIRLILILGLQGNPNVLMLPSPKNAILIVISLFIRGFIIAECTVLAENRQRLGNSPDCLPPGTN